MPSQTQDRINIGHLTFLAWGMGGAITAASLFLGVIAFDVVAVPFIAFFMTGILLVAVSGTAGMVGHGKTSSSTVLFGIIMTVFVLVLDAYLSTTFFGLAVEQADQPLLTFVLFAIYEETFMLGIWAALKVAHLPDILIIILSTLIFLPLHAFAYPDVLLFNIFICGARLTLSSAFAICDNSDVPMWAHIIYNALQVVWK